MSSSASPAPSRRKTLLSLGVLALLTGIVVFIFREHWAEISEALSRLTLGQGLPAPATALDHPEATRFSRAYPAGSSSAAACPISRCGRVSTMHGWGPSAMWWASAQGRCHFRRGISTGAGWTLAPAWG